MSSSDDQLQSGFRMSTQYDFSCVQVLKLQGGAEVLDAPYWTCCQ